jgi:hypothetical protein
MAHNGDKNRQIGCSEQNFRRLRITDSVRLEFEGVVREARSAMREEDTVFRPYDASSKPDQHEVEYLALEDVPFIETQFDPLDSPLNLATSSGSDEEFLKDLRFYVVVVEFAGEEPVYWCRGCSRQKELGHSRMFGILMSNGQFDQVREPMFLFDQYLDCVASVGDHLKT